MTKPFEELSQPGKWARQHNEYYREKSRKWRRMHPEYNREYSKEWNAKMYARKKLKAMQIVSVQERPVCSNCGCEDIRMLQINHKNGGGGAEKRANNWKPLHFYLAIISGERPAEDLNVLCGVCNIKHYYEMKYGPLLFEVRYLGSAMQCSGKEE
jgi:hypothetical protein